MGHKNNFCIDCGKNIWDGSSRCKSCARKGIHESCKIRHATNSKTDDELRQALIHLYITENKTQKEISKMLGVTSIFQHLKRLGIKKTGKFQRNTNIPSSGWTHTGINARYISINGVEMLEHRFIMEQHIGRPLKNNEVVHHINENRLDNRIENLQLMTKSSHSTYHNTGKTRTGQLTEEGRRRKSEASKRAWANGVFDNRPPITEKTKTKISKSMKKLRSTRFWSTRSHADTVSSSGEASIL